MEEKSKEKHCVVIATMPFHCIQVCVCVRRYFRSSFVLSSVFLWHCHCQCDACVAILFLLLQKIFLIRFVLYEQCFDGCSVVVHCMPSLHRAYTEHKFSPHTIQRSAMSSHLNFYCFALSLRNGNPTQTVRLRLLYMARRVTLCVRVK